MQSLLSPWDRRVPPWSLVRLGFDGFLWGGTAFSSAFMGVHPGGRPGCLGLLGCVLVVVRFIRGAGFIGVRHGNHRFHMGALHLSGCALGVVEFIRDCWVRRGAPWVSTGSSLVAGYIGVRPGNGRVYQGWLDRSGCALGLIGFIHVRWVRHGGHPVHHETLGTLACGLGVIRFIWVR